MADTLELSEQQYEAVLCEKRALFENLTSTQARCTELLLEARGLRAILRQFVEDARTPMGDYAPGVVCPCDGDDPVNHFVRAWAKKFADALLVDARLKRF